MTYLKPLMVTAAMIAVLAGSTQAFQPNTPSVPAGKPLSAEAQEMAKKVREKQKSVAEETADVETRAKAEEMIERAEKYLRSCQDKETGGWSVAKPDQEGKAQAQMPGITALVINAMLMDPKADPEKDGAIKAGVGFMLKYVQPDGGIYDKVLPCYNTSLCVSALSKVHSKRAKEAMDGGVAFLKRLQWSEEADAVTGGRDAAKPVKRDHPFYGGVGYGSHGRPDNSNLNMFMQAMEDARVSPSDEAVKRALVFLSRTQMDDRVNDQAYAKGSRQGGFVYATAENAESVDGRAGQSSAGQIEETLSDGTKASRLRAYGSMTYAGFKTYVYAELPRTDQRVISAYDWIRRNYSVSENPGMGESGMYYYYVVFARALKSWGEPTVKLLSATNTPTGQERAWRKDLVERMTGLQNEDGSFKSVDKRWMESNPELITAYGVTALRQVVGE
jgi:squalene-hopene/tetraprenyl-beta-curcumene cyclase